MCYLVVERYSVCRCLYYQHSVDMCAAYGTQGHGVQERTVLVGYACDKHSTHQSYQDPYAQEDYSDSGYHTASHSSHTHSSRQHRRWNILSSITGYSWQSRPLVRFELDHWIKYLFSFRRRISSAPPSELTLLFMGHNRTTSTSGPWPKSHATISTSYTHYLIQLYNDDRRVNTRDAMLSTKLLEARKNIYITERSSLRWL